MAKVAKQKRTCARCGHDIDVRGPRLYCTSCSRKNEKEKAQRVDSVGRLKRKTLIAERGDKCELCGAKGTLHAHHIKPMKDGGTDDSKNLLLVCPSCHKKFHRSRK